MNGSSVLREANEVEVRDETSSCFGAGSRKVGTMDSVKERDLVSFDLVAMELVLFGRHILRLVLLAWFGCFVVRFAKNYETIMSDRLQSARENNIIQGTKSLRNQDRQ